jgi:hypothetical protein
MRASTPSAPALRLVPRLRGTINADLVAFTVMDQIDATYPGLWQALPIAARGIIRGMIVRAVTAEDAKR